MFKTIIFVSICSVILSGCSTVNKSNKENIIVKEDLDKEPIIKPISTEPIINNESPVKLKASVQEIKDEKYYPTGAYSVDHFNILVLKLINMDKLDRAEIYIRSRKKDVPNQDLSYLEKRLAKAKKRFLDESVN